MFILSHLHHLISFLLFSLWFLDFPRTNSEGPTFSPNTPRYLTSLKLSQITHSFSLRFQLQVSAVPQSCPLSVTHILSLGWTLLLTHSCTNSGTKVSEGTLQLFLLTHCKVSAAETFCIFSHWLGKVEVCSDGSRTDKNFIAPCCEKSCNCFSTQAKLQIFC